MNGSNLTKKDGSEREIEKPSNEEEKHQRKILGKLKPEVYSNFEDFVFGIPGKGQHDAIEKFEEYRDNGYQWVAKLDVKDCFDSIGPKKALSLIDYSFEGIPEISERDGLPEGHPLSSLLEEIYLDQLDKKIASWTKNGCKVIRWRDDIWLMSKTKKEVLSYAYSLNSFAQELGLDLDMDSRTEVKHVNQGVEILGFTVSGKSKGPSPKNIRKHKKCIINFQDGILKSLRNSDYEKAVKLRERLKATQEGHKRYFQLTDKEYKIQYNTIINTIDTMDTMKGTVYN